MSDTLYNRLGGQAGIEKLVKTFYDRVTADPELTPYFKDADMAKLRHMQQEFFAAAMGGPSTYHGRPLNHAHAGLGISGTAFSKFAVHLLETMRSEGASDEDVQVVASRLAVYAPEITSESTEPD